MHKTVSIFGLGYIGLPTAAMLASHGMKVIGVDVNEHVVTTVNAGRVHIMEPGLAGLVQDVVRDGRLRATDQPEPADAFIIAVPTPFSSRHKPDLSYIVAVAKSIAPVLARGNLVILESTSPVGTTERLAELLAAERPDLVFPQQGGDKADVHIAYCPERILPGRMLYELAANSRIVGGMSAEASRRAVSLYKAFVSGDITVTDTRTAELCKLTENSFRDVNIAFANELSMICGALAIDVWELIRLANRHPRVNILQPGPGVGGHCIAVDPWFIVDSAPEEANLIKKAREVNDHKPLWIVEQIKAAIADALAAAPGRNIADVTVACLGLAFKPDIDDLRESPAVNITLAIARLGCQVLAVEPHIDALPTSLQLPNVNLASFEEALQQAEVMCLLVGHSAFAQVAQYLKSYMRCVDTVGLLSQRTCSPL